MSLNRGPTVYAFSKEPIDIIKFHFSFHRLSPHTYYTMALLSEGGHTFPDVLITAYLLILSFTAVTLNITVIKANLRKPSSVARNLYLALFVTDFLGCLVVPVYYAYATFMPKDRRCYEAEKDPQFGFLINCTTHYLTFGLPHPSILSRVYSVVSWTLLFVPCVITGCLAACRLYQIRYPFSHLSSRGPMIAIALTTLYNLVFMADLLRPKGDDSVAWFYVLSQAVFVNVMSTPTVFGVNLGTMGKTFLASNIFNLLFQAIGLVASVLTLIEICKTLVVKPVSIITPGMKSNNRKRRSTLMVLLYNLGSLLTALTLVTHAISSTGNEEIMEKAMVTRQPMEMNYVTVVSVLAYSIFVPSLCSLLNPVIAIMCSKGNGNIIRISIQSDPDLVAPDLVTPRFSDRINFPRNRKLTVFNPDLVATPI
eukprot:sb/3464982/